MRLLLRLLLPLALLLGPVAAFAGVVEAAEAVPMSCCEGTECPCPAPVPSAPRAPQAPATPFVGSVAAVRAARPARDPKRPEPRPWPLRVTSSPAPGAVALRPLSPPADPPDPGARQSLLGVFRK